MNFENQIKQWVQLDNQILEMTNNIKELRDKRNNINKNITNYISANNLFNSSVKISDGKLKFVNTKIQEPLTFKYLEKSLKEIINNDKQVEQIIEHIKQKREYKIIPEIKRYSNN